MSSHMPVGLAGEHAAALPTDEVRGLYSAPQPSKHWVTRGFHTLSVWLQLGLRSLDSCLSATAPDIHGRSIAARNTEAGSARRRARQPGTGDRPVQRPACESVRANEGMTDGLGWCCRTPAPEPATSVAAPDQWLAVPLEVYLIQ